jgi:pimeloyl-ACP methyl ester carboxylesterase
MAFAEPLSSDAAYLSSMPNTIDGPFIPVGHSYGGMVITDVANGNQSVKALVYSTAFAPDTGRRGRAVVPISRQHSEDERGGPHSARGRQPSAGQVPIPVRG